MTSVSKHWRRQLWGVGARATLDFQQFTFFYHTLELKMHEGAISHVKCLQDFPYHNY